MHGELPHGIGKLPGFNDTHPRRERKTRDRHCEPAKIFASDVDDTVVRCELNRRVVVPSERALELGERGLNLKRRGQRAGRRAQ